MHLMPRELEKLMIHSAGELAKTRKARGLKLNYVEAIAMITSEVMEAARDGKTVEDLQQWGATVVKKSDVMEGVDEMVSYVQVEATFDDGTKMVTVHNPIR